MEKCIGNVAVAAHASAISTLYEYESRSQSTVENVTFLETGIIVSSRDSLF